MTKKTIKGQQVTVLRSKEAWNQHKKFEKAALPLIRYLCENHPPHTAVIVTTTTAELLEGSMTVVTERFVRD